MEIVDVRKVRAIVLKNGKILITEAKKSGAFILPGGKIEQGESKRNAIYREVLEETGIELNPNEIKGPFFTDSYDYTGHDEYGRAIPKRVTTDFFIATTTKDIDYKKMHLSPREIARQSHPYWINPSILEYKLTNQKEQFQNAYAIRYSSEYLNAYKKFVEYQRKRQIEEEREK